MAKEHVDWLGPEEKEKTASWERFQALSSAEKEAVFSVCVAAMLRGQLSINPNAVAHLEHLIADVQPPFAQVRPPLELFWSRLSKPTLLGILKEVGGKELESATNYKKMKKSELALFCYRLFEDPVGAEFDLGDGDKAVLSEQAVASVKTWTLPGFEPKH